MTPSEEKWAERVRLWRESGQTAREFSTGREFTAGGLRHWAYRLKNRGTAAEPAPAVEKPVRLARVERVTSAAPLTVEIGPARLHICAGADAKTLRATIGALVGAARGGAW
jgi:hypothetical protein